MRQKVTQRNNLCMKRLAILAALGLASCTPPTYNAGTTDPATLAPWSGSGPATIKGQAFLTTQGGSVITCAGQTVRAIPATDYNTSIISAITSGHTILGAPTPAQAFDQASTKTTICDAQGNFEFSNLQAQSWIIETLVQWTADGPQGGALLSAVQLQPGVNKVILDQDNTFYDPLGFFSN